MDFSGSRYGSVFALVKTVMNRQFS